MEYLIFASSALITPLADYFSSLVRHGFMPHCFQDCVLIPVPKKNKDATCSSSYHPIALASKPWNTSSLLSILPSFILVCFNLGSNLAPQLLCALVLLKISYHGTFIVVLSFMGVFLILVKHYLILLITVFCFKNSLIVVYV